MNEKNTASTSRIDGVEITYAFPKIGTLVHLEFTNNRENAVHLMEDGFIPCLTPQMFLAETGIYGLYLQEDGRKLSKVDAEQYLSSCEQSARDANQKIFSRYGNQTEQPA